MVNVLGLNLFKCWLPNEGFIVYKLTSPHLFHADETIRVRDEGYELEKHPCG